MLGSVDSPWENCLGGGGNALVGCRLQGRAGEQEEGGWEKLWLVCGMSRKPLNKKNCLSNWSVENGWVSLSRIKL